jgi:hypothetical protein
MRAMLLSAAILMIASASQAQIIYEPVQYQYSAGGTTYYYSGCDPRVHEIAAWPTAGAGVNWGRGNGISFRSGNVHTHREVVTERTRTFTDELPYRNAYVFGYDANDAQNEAYARQPTFFRKRDLVRAALPHPSGRGWVVPACWSEYPPPGEIVIRSSNGVVRKSPATRQARPILIIPKDLLDREMQKPTAPVESQITRTD